MFGLFGVKFLSIPERLKDRLTKLASIQEKLVQQLLSCPGIDEAVALMTCNRIEFYFICKPSHRIDEFMINWLASLDPDISQADIKDHAYQYSHQEAITHLLKTATGIDSIILGETQVLGQLKKAYLRCCQSGAAGKQFSAIFPRIFNATKAIRSDSNLNKYASSLGAIVRSICSEVPSKSLLFIGTGQVFQSVIPYLSKYTITIATKNMQRNPESFAHKLVHYDTAVQQIETFDIIISATNQDDWVLSPKHLGGNHDKPQMIIDLGSPKNVDPTVKKLKRITLIDLDYIHQLAKLRQSHKQLMETNSKHSIYKHARHIYQQTQPDEVIKNLISFRQQIEKIQNEQTQLALKELKSGKSAEIILRQSLQQLCNKVLHIPTINLKKAPKDHQENLISLAKQLFEVEGEC